jgi:molybdopterin converting factor small subunit
MKKKITVRYFALFREHAGISGETLDSDAETAATCLPN